MTATNLDFVQFRDSSLPANLNFGTTGIVQLSFKAALPTLTASLKIGQGVYLGFRAALPVLSGSMRFNIDLNNLRWGLAHSTGIEWGSHAVVSRSVGISYPIPGGMDLKLGIVWGYAQAVSAATRVAYRVNGQLANATRILWGTSQALSRSVVVAYDVPKRLDDSTRIPWGSLPALSREYVIKWLHPAQLTKQYRIRLDTPSAKYADVRVRWLQPAPLKMVVDRIPWGLGQRLVVGVSPPIPPIVIPPIQWIGDADLDFICPISVVRFPVNLNFGNHPCAETIFKIIPIQRVYYVSNIVELVRLPDRTSIECFSANLSIDSSSWGWNIQASIDPSAWSLLYPDPHDPVEIELKINGTETFVGVVTGLSRSRAFPTKQVDLTAVSRAAWLSAPLAPSIARLNTSAKNAQQLVNDALLAAPFAGPLGFSLVWGLTDWLVPANAFSHTGTPMEYISEIAGAVGASVQAHRSAWQLLIQPQFKVAGWHWQTETPDFIVPIDAVITDSLQWDDLPDINAVALTGGSAGGIIDIVKRQGTAGDKSLSPINSPLFTHLDATRQRAVKELSQTGRRLKSSITMPIHPSVGIIDNNKLLRITDGVDNVTWVTRSVKVSASLPDIKQTIELERYEYLV